MICSRCKTEPTDRLLPRPIRKVTPNPRHAKQDYERLKEAGRRMIPGPDGKAVAAWIPRIACDCSYRALLRYVEPDLLALVLDPEARREERRRAGLDRYLHSPKEAA